MCDSIAPLSVEHLCSDLSCICCQMRVICCRQARLLSHVMWICAFRYHDVALQAEEAEGSGDAAADTPDAEAPAADADDDADDE